MPKKKGKKLEPEQVEQHLDAYSKANTEALLDDAFGKWDRIFDPSEQIPYIDRADHIIIGGRTASELLMEKFEQEFPNIGGKKYSNYQRPTAYQLFYHENGKKYVNQMVSEAMAKGETVEVFVPDKRTGRIKDEPMKLTPSGYQPAGPLAKPAQLTRWQKFWNKFGFYKQEKAAVVDYEKKMAVRDRVRFCNKAGRGNLCTNHSLSDRYHEEVAKLHPEMVEDMQKNFPNSGGNYEKLAGVNGFRTSRSSFVANALCVLATKKDENGKPLYTNDQLFDMEDPKMQKARADAMKEVYDHYKPGALLRQEQEKKAAAEQKGEKYEIDPKLAAEAAKAQDWLVDLQYEASGVLRDRISEHGAKLDFSKPDITDQKDYRVFALLSDTAFDVSQDMTMTQKRMDEKYGKGAYWAGAGKVGDCSQPAREFGKSLRAQKNILNGIPGKVDECFLGETKKMYRAQTIQQQIGKTLKENPGMKYADAANVKLLSQAASISAQAEYEDDLMTAHDQNAAPLPALMGQGISLAREYQRDPEQFGRQIRTGVLENRMKLQELGDFGEDSMGRKIEGRFELRDAKTVEREMQREQKQQQKTDDAPAL